MLSTSLQSRPLKNLYSTVKIPLSSLGVTLKISLMAVTVNMLLFLMLTTSHTQAASFNIAVADNLVALMQSDIAKKKLAELKKELKKEQKKIEKLQDELKELKQQAERDGPIMTETAKSKLLKTIEDKNIDYNFLVQKYQKRQQEGQQAIVKELKPKFEQAVKKVIQEGGYDIVLHRQALIYAGEAYDISKEITTTINQLSK